MSIYPNPFHARASEQHRDPHQFITTFGAGAVDMLPAGLWDRLIVVRSSPGAGKTSLMRLFAADSLEWVAERVSTSEAVYTALKGRDILVDRRPSIIATRIGLDRDYRAILDLGLEPSSAVRLFLRLLDTRIMAGVIRAALRIAQMHYPSDAHRFLLEANDEEPENQETINRLGGPSGKGFLDYAQDTERMTLKLLDALLASDLSDDLVGHSTLLSLRALDGAQIRIDGKALDQQVVLMFDDGHALEYSQRSILLKQLQRRRPRVGRWYAERFEALSSQELMEDGSTDGRDIATVNLDEIAQEGLGSRFHKGRHDTILVDVAVRRAAPVLATYAREEQGFFTLLEDPTETGASSRIEQGTTAIRERLLQFLGEVGPYETWFESADNLSGRHRLNRWKEVEIIVHRDSLKGLPLFGEEPVEQLAARASSAVREGSELLVAHEFGLPYYGGKKRVTALGSSNIEQFLNLCGDLFDELLVDVSLGRKPFISAERQHQICTRASERYWTSIGRTIPNGRDVQALVNSIDSIARLENGKPNLPYAPGVTGTALLMSDRARLLDVAYRRRTPGADRLFAALASALAHNVLAAKLDRSSKHRRYMVLYLNRLLCPRFKLPLGLGGYRERPLSTMIEWTSPELRVLTEQPRQFGDGDWQ